MADKGKGKHQIYRKRLEFLQETLVVFAIRFPDPISGNLLKTCASLWQRARFYVTLVGFPVCRRFAVAAVLP